MTHFYPRTYHNIHIATVRTVVTTETILSKEEDHDVKEKKKSEEKETKQENVLFKFYGIQFYDIDNRRVTLTGNCLWRYIHLWKMPKTI